MYVCVRACVCAGYYCGALIMGVIDAFHVLYEHISMCVNVYVCVCVCVCVYVFIGFWSASTIGYRFSPYSL